VSIAQKRKKKKNPTQGFKKAEGKQTQGSLKASARQKKSYREAQGKK